MTHTVRLTGPAQREYARRLIAAAPDYAVVTVKAGDRTLDQNAKMWVMLTEISKAMPDGRKWTPGTWKAACMPTLGHQVQFCEGLDNSGPFPLGFKSSKLNKAQMADLITVIQEYGDRHGVQWSI